MDVSISSADKQAREAVIKARDDKQTAQAVREEKREARRMRKVAAVTAKRLRRRIEKEVLGSLLMERQHYLAGEATGDQYLIDTRISYKGDSWRKKRSKIESVLTEVLAKHTGFEHKFDFVSDRDDWCSSIRISYTLLEH